jgi:hypothetical protein
VTKPGSQRLIIGLAVTTAVASSAILVLVLRGVPAPDFISPLLPAAAISAVNVLLIAFVLLAFIFRFPLIQSRLFPWVVGEVSLLASIVPWWIVVSGNQTLAGEVYRELRVPQGIEQFWDLALVLRSVDCSSFGFDVYAANNGCLVDPSIYGPGTLWLQYVPFDIFSARNAPILGVISIVVSSLVLVWLARISTGRARLVLLVAAAGAPWLLMLERGNFDAFVIWTAAAAVLLVRRYPALWAWSLAAAGIWLMGTWKYYPFAMGLMLLPLLRVRRGWIVLVGFAVASITFVALTWENFRFSASANAGIVDLGNFAILGRVPLVAHIGAEGSHRMMLGTLLVFIVAALACAWGATWGLTSARSLGAKRPHEAMLAVAGSSMYLVSVLASGFGYAYKAAFLLLAVPLLGRPRNPRSRVTLTSSLVMLALTAVSSIVVWNTVLATLAGIIAASFALGASGAVLVRHLLPGRQRVKSPCSP